MNHENQLIDALLTVMSWDVQDEDFAQAVNDQAKLMSGMSPEEILEEPSETH